jgi:hypothetical protein
MRLAALQDDPAVNYVLKMYSFPPVTEEQQGFKDIVIFKPVPHSEAPD